MKQVWLQLLTRAPHALGAALLNHLGRHAIQVLAREVGAVARILQGEGGVAYIISMKSQAPQT